MVKKRPNIDNFFRRNLSDFELSKKEGNWELLNHLLNERERKKKRRRWFLLIFCFLIMLTSGLFVLLSENKSTEDTGRSKRQSNTSVPSNSFENKTGKSIGVVLPANNEVEKSKKNIADQIKPQRNFNE